MKKNRSAAAMIAVLVLLSSSARAWDDVGHRVVARIAWANISDKTKKNVIALLMKAPGDADLRSLMPTNGAKDDRNRLFFVSAATWPDIVRDDNNLARQKKFHRPTHHFINFFFKQVGPKNESVDENREPEPQPENVVERLTHYNTSVVDSRSGAERSIELAWILHLVGDINQPLHCSARITDKHQDGDRGGNLFLLSGKQPNLHSFWDHILDLSFDKLPGEGDNAFVDRLAATLMEHHPKSSMAALINPGKFNEWAQNGHATAKRIAYPITLKENQNPGEGYRITVEQALEPALALAGYRLAEMLDRLFGK